MLSSGEPASSGCSAEPLDVAEVEPVLQQRIDRDDLARLGPEPAFAPSTVQTKPEAGVETSPTIDSVPSAPTRTAQ